MQITAKHEYLYQPGLWDMAGVYYDRNNNPFPQKGTLLVSHEGDLWVVETTLTITTHETQHLASRYEVKAPAPEAAFTEWKSEAGGPEPLYGLYVFVGDTIMSPWQSKSGAYWGQEVLTRTAENEYQARGFAFLEKEMAQAWSTTLTFNG